MKRYKIDVYGRVQGVGFRYFVYGIAKEYDITGWVKNSYEFNIVNLECQGALENLEKFITKLKSGNRFSRIENINIQEITYRVNEKGFSIDV